MIAKPLIIISIGLFLINFNAFSLIDKVKLNSLDFHFSNKSGTGSIKSLKLESKDTNLWIENEQFSIEKSNLSFIKAKLGTSILVNSKITDKSIFHDLKALKIQSFSLIGENNTRLTAKSPLLHFSMSDESQKISNFSLNCVNNSGEKKETLFNFIDPCFLKGTFKTSAIYLDQETFKSLFIPALSKNNLSIKGPFDISKLKNVSMNISNNNFSLTAKIKKVISVTLKMSGKIKHDKEKNIISIRLDKAKVGFISIRSEIIKMIKKSSKKSVEVKGNIILIHI